MNGLDSLARDAVPNETRPEHSAQSPHRSSMAGLSHQRGTEPTIFRQRWETRVCPMLFMPRLRSPRL